jgi:hypothetical protein
MKTKLLKILSFSALILVFGSGISLADGYRHHRGHGHGHYKHRVHHSYHHYYAPPPPVYVEHCYRPVVVERRYYYEEPVRYLAPAPSGFFFGVSAADAGSAFSFGISGR